MTGDRRKTLWNRQGAVAFLALSLLFLRLVAACHPGEQANPSRLFSDLVICTPDGIVSLGSKTPAAPDHDPLVDGCCFNICFSSLGDRLAQAELTKTAPRSYYLAGALPGHEDLGLTGFLLNRQSHPRAPPVISSSFS
ncbi:hypothetical protein [Kiloniella laminariae]|uniref:hypothetical protein n=1 Tax=Kiloniella laminariae TaxID=454162 RepID=UPI0012F888C3|nr:hypothetical protein [Kiloniella laminariae]